SHLSESRKPIPATWKVNRRRGNGKGEEPCERKRVTSSKLAAAGTCAIGSGATSAALSSRSEFHTAWGRSPPAASIRPRTSKRRPKQHMATVHGGKTPGEPIDTIGALATW